MDAFSIVKRLMDTADPKLNSTDAATVRESLRYKVTRRWILTLFHNMKKHPSGRWTTAEIQGEMYDKGENPWFNYLQPLINLATLELSYPGCELYEDHLRSTGPGALIQSVNEAWEVTARFRQLFPNQSAMEIPNVNGIKCHAYYDVVVGGSVTPDDVTIRTEVASTGETIKRQEHRFNLLGARITKKDGAATMTGVQIDRVLNEDRTRSDGSVKEKGEYEVRTYHCYGLACLEINGKEYTFTPEERSEMARIEADRQAKLTRRGR